MGGAGTKQSYLTSSKRGRTKPDDDIRRIVEYRAERSLESVYLSEDLESLASMVISDAFDNRWSWPENYEGWEIFKEIHGYFLGPAKMTGNLEETMPGSVSVSRTDVMTYLDTVSVSFEIRAEIDGGYLDMFSMKGRDIPFDAAHIERAISGVKNAFSNLDNVDFDIGPSPDNSDSLVWGSSAQVSITDLAPPNVDL